MNYETDKISSGLLSVYETLWKNLRGTTVKLLEIGVARGGSLRFWADFFSPASQLVGVDLKLPKGVFPPNVKLVHGDQNDTAFLRRLGQEYGTFDLIIDDGSHFTRETRNCFAALWPHVAIDGWYVIEDWAVGYWKDSDTRYKGMVEVVTDIMRDAPAQRIIGFQISLKPGQAYAAFRKGIQGWQV
jgi:cephalosporin hydroxylase